MDSLLCYMVINKVLSIKEKVVTFKHNLNRGIHLSASKISKWNSVVQAFLTCLHLIKGYMIYSFTLMISALFGGLITMPA